MILRVPCPAKLNLFLSVGPADHRGYHPLRTIFQAVSLFDELLVEHSDRDEVICSDPAVPADNTVSRTLRLLAEVVELPRLKVTLNKNIPSQAGLGGGSSDAAGLIRAAKVLSRHGLPHAEMFGLAQTIGADVPFFLVGGRAKAEGYGERLQELADEMNEWFVLAKPPVGCDTKASFQKLDEKSYSWREFPDPLELYNDFERVAPCECIELIERLQVHGATGAGLTGSGSAVFGKFPDEREARKAAEIAEQESSARVWVVRSLTRAESLQVQVAN